MFFGFASGPPAPPSLTAPANGVDVYEGVGVTVSATVPAGQVPTRIDWVLDPQTAPVVVATDSAAAYSQTWTPTGIAAGAHTLVARSVYGAVSVDSTPIDLVVFDPSLLSPSIWLRADMGVTDVSGRASLWANQGSGGTDWDVVQDTAGQRPLITASSANLNGKPTLTYDKTRSDRLKTAGAAGPLTQPTSWLAVLRIAVFDTEGSYLLSDNTGSGQILYTSGQYQLNAGTLLGGGALATPVVMAIGAVCDGATSELYRTAKTPLAGAAGANSQSGLALGHYTGNADWDLDGEIAEVVAFSSDIGAASMGRLLDYASARYGITIGA